MPIFCKKWNVRQALSCALILLAGCTGVPYESVCSVHTNDGQGSGTLVDVRGEYGVVVTCRHVAEREGRPVKLRWHTGQETEGYVDYVYPGTNVRNDLAVIVCAKPDGVSPASYRRFDPTRGPFTSVGYRCDETGRNVYVSVAKSGEEVLDRVELSAPFQFGMSGGGCFDCDGYLFGVVSSTSRDEGTAADGRYLADMLSRYE